MTAVQLKKVLISKISQIDDVEFLKAIKTILDSKSVYGTLMLSAEQKEEIAASRAAIERGEFIEHADLEKEIKAWLSEK